MEILQNPIIVAVLSLLVVPGVVSFVVARLRRLSDDGVKPQAVLYVVSAVLVAVAMFTSGAKLPGIDMANPAESILVWQVFTAAFTKYTGILYDVLLSRFWPTPEPVPAPEPAPVVAPTK